jgi:hypothetical protein
MMLRLHWHRDPSYQVRGANAYFQCRCGARRTVHWIRNLGSPIPAGWPALVDPHGSPVEDSGWVKVS